MFKNRIRFDIFAFEKTTTDQVLSVTLSNASGYLNSKANLASLKNSGIFIDYKFGGIELSSTALNTLRQGLPKAPIFLTTILMVDLSEDYLILIMNLPITKPIILQPYRQLAALII